MGDHVCDGTEFSCPFCTSKLKLKVPSSPVTGQSKKLANMGNCFFPPPGGQCTVIPQAPVPCTPAASPIDPGQSPVKISGLPALGAGCKFQCAKGGLLTVSSSGQSKAKHEEASGIGGAAAAAAGPLIDVGSDRTPKKDEKKKVKKSDTPASAPVGSKRVQHQHTPYQKSRNAPKTINGRVYKGHTLDQMQNRGITPRVVEETIKNGQSRAVIRNGKNTTIHYDPKNNISVVTNDKGGVVTASYGKFNGNK